MATNLIKAPLILFTALGLSGCAHNCIYASFPGHNSTQKLGPSFLGRTVELSNIHSSKTPSELFVGIGALQNLTNKPQRISYQYSWLDATGLPVGEHSSMVPLELSPNESVVISGVSPTNQAAQFTLKVCQ
tara:strand:+ start:112 stop:504 length:393 start_codon:yes stop_codon:yes gene_type:complete